MTAVQQFEQGGRGSHTGSESEPANAPLQVGNAFLVGVPRRVVTPRVFPALVLARTPLHVSGTGEYRRHDGPGRRIRLLAGVDCPRGQALLVAAFPAHWKSAFLRR